MRTVTLFVISAVGSVGAASFYEQPVMAAVLLVGHAIAWQNHVLEMKVNRLLSEAGISVSTEEERR